MGCAIVETGWDGRADFGNTNAIPKDLLITHLRAFRRSDGTSLGEAFHEVGLRVPADIVTLNELVATSH